MCARTKFQCNVSLSGVFRIFFESTFEQYRRSDSVSGFIGANAKSGFLRSHS